MRSKYTTTDYRLLRNKAQSEYKDQDLSAVTLNNIRKFVELPDYDKLYMHFIRFCWRIQFICERSAENELMQFRFGLVSVQIRCICETALTNVILDLFISLFVNSIIQDLNCTGFWSHHQVNVVIYYKKQ